MRRTVISRLGFLLLSLLALLCAMRVLERPEEDDISVLAAQGVQRLYDQQQTALERAAAGFFALRAEAGAAREMVLERDRAGGYLWYDYTDYEQWACALPEDLSELTDLLFADYDVRRIVIDADALRFEIAEDGLVRALDRAGIPEDHVLPLENGWYHTWFEYGV